MSTTKRQVFSLEFEREALALLEKGDKKKLLPDFRLASSLISDNSKQM